MAVFDGLPGVEVTVLLGTQTMAEYDAEAVEISPLATIAEFHQHNHTVTKYIESIDDAEFDIKFTVGEAFNLECQFLSFKTEVDGTFIGSPAMHSQALKIQKQWSRVLSGPESKTVAGVLIKQMKFAKLDISKLPVQIMSKLSFNANYIQLMTAWTTPASESRLSRCPPLERSL